MKPHLLPSLGRPPGSLRSKSASPQLSWLAQIFDQRKVRIAARFDGVDLGQWSSGLDGVFQLSARNTNQGRQVVTPDSPLAIDDRLYVG